MKTINNHSLFNQAIQRNGFIVRKNNVEAVFNYKLEMRVGRKLRAIWLANKHKFLSKYGISSSSGKLYMDNRYEYRLQDLIELHGQDSQSLAKLEQLIDTDGYEALENYLTVNLNLA